MARFRKEKGEKKKKKKKGEEPQFTWQMAPPVDFSPDIKAQNESQALLITARQGAGFPIAAGQLGHAIESRATHVLLDYTQAACAIRYQIDGAWEELPPLDRRRKNCPNTD